MFLIRCLTSYKCLKLVYSQIFYTYQHLKDAKKSVHYKEFKKNVKIHYYKRVYLAKNWFPKLCPLNQKIPLLQDTLLQEATVVSF